MPRKKTAKLGRALDELIEEFSSPDSTPTPTAPDIDLDLWSATMKAFVGFYSIIAISVGVGVAVHHLTQTHSEGVSVPAGTPTPAGYAMWVGNTIGLGACLRTEPNEQSKQAKPCYIDGKQVTATGTETNSYMLISQPDNGWLPKRFLLTARPAAATAPPTPPALIPNPTSAYTSTSALQAQAGAIAVPDLKLSIPSYTRVYRNGEKLPFEITLVGAPGAYKEGQPYNNYEILIMLFQACCTGPQIFLNSDATGRIKGDIPLRNLPPGTYYLEAHPSTFKTKTYEGFRRAPNSSSEAEKYYPLSTKRIELKIEN